MSSKLYNSLIRSVDKFVPDFLRPMWMHSAGPKTVFFWAPMFKWGLVIAGLGDINRPPEKLSINQSLVLATTGIVWCRYSLVIIPKNMFMFSVNAFMSALQFYQVYRAVNYQRSHLQIKEKNLQMCN